MALNKLQMPLVSENRFLFTFIYRKITLFENFKMIQLGYVTKVYISLGFSPHIDKMINFTSGNSENLIL